MEFPEEIFRSYDIRGTVDQLSPELAYRVGQAMVKMTGAKKVVVGYDMRATSPELAQKAIEGITSMGANVVNIGQATTPLLNFALSYYPDHEAGLMVTASHNPAEYNGFKMMRGDAMPISGKEVQKLIKEEEVGEEVGRVKGEVTTKEVVDEYLDYVVKKAAAPDLKGMKVVIDAGNGMSEVVLPKLFARLACEMIPMYFEPDGTFPNHEANPIKLETLTDLKKKVLAEKADLGIALDGDGDRVIFVDEKGDHINGDVMLAILADSRLKGNPERPVVWSANASWAVRDAIEANRGLSIMEKVGRTNIIKRVKKEAAVIGGEVSAHYFYPEFSGLESTDFTILLVLKLLKKSGGPMSELVKPFAKYVISGEINFAVKDKEAAIESLGKKYKGQALEISTLDGIRSEFKDWWFNIRPSNTEPLIRLNLEAKSQELMATKRDEIAAFIKSL
ncbi:phosphomannomutase/phosphoglucomutase [Patescibacteria group bacterium]|nr:phosphomannomutase/phosphoglucomutase [Patescibacteria group bacterium]